MALGNGENCKILEGPDHCPIKLNNLLAKHEISLREKNNPVVRGYETGQSRSTFTIRSTVYYLVCFCSKCYFDHLVVALLLILSAVSFCDFAYAAVCLINSF